MSDEKIVANLPRILDEFLERAARSCAYRACEWLRDNEIDVLSAEETPTWREEQLAEALEERIRDVFYELFEIQRAEDASDPTNDIISRSLFGIQRALEQVERRLCERRSVVDNRGVEE